MKKFLLGFVSGVSAVLALKCIKDFFAGYDVDQFLSDDDFDDDDWDGDFDYDFCNGCNSDSKSECNCTSNESSESKCECVDSK